MGHDFTILISGAAGQGIQTIGSLLDGICHNAGRGTPFDPSLEFTGSGNGRVVMRGARAAALGALAADCRFFPFYPMRPGIPIITHPASFADQVPIVVAQAEDETAAVNMAIVPMDQYLVDAAMTEPKEFDPRDACKPFLQTDPVTKEAQVSRGETYQRYRFTTGGISPRILPCTGAGRYFFDCNHTTDI